MPGLKSAGKKPPPKKRPFCPSQVESLCAKKLSRLSRQSRKAESQIQVQQKRLVYLHAQQSVDRRRDTRQQSRSFAVGINR
jgi:hypothetical protein